MRDRHEGRQVHYNALPQGLAPLIDWMSFYGAFYGPMTQPTGDLPLSSSALDPVQMQSAADVQYLSGGKR